MNISGVVVTVSSSVFADVLESLEQSDLCEVHLTDNSHRIVITLEGETVSEEMTKLKRIQAMDHVISAEMVYSYAEEELEQLREGVDAQIGQVPQVLEDDSADASDIHYGGHAV